jgi:hypothetical protein
MIQQTQPINTTFKRSSHTKQASATSTNSLFSSTNQEGKPNQLQPSPIVLKKNIKSGKGGNQPI